MRNTSDYIDAPKALSLAAHDYSTEIAVCAIEDHETLDGPCLVLEPGGCFRRDLCGPLAAVASQGVESEL